MYIIRTNRIIPEFAVEDYLERFDRANEIAAGSSSFLGALILNSMGYPSVYTTLIQFENRTTAREFHASSDWRTFTWENPTEGMGTRIGLQEAYELVHGRTNSGEAKFAMISDWTLDLDPRVFHSFIEQAKNIYRLRAEHGQGVAASQLLSFLGNPTKFVEIELYASRDDIATTHQSPEVLEQISVHPASEFSRGTPEMDLCEVIRKI